ncbi:MAG: Xaa-Pro peptidase family protein [Pseudomonadota bacterium]|nr:Xaa-Pro peptidase family protein [Pseudomonadota bacterium]
MNKRSLIKYTAAITAGTFLSDSFVFAKKKEKDPIDFKNMTETAEPITPNERKQRLRKSQELMQAQGIEALVLEAGSALIYFTGVKWRRSERFTGAIIPKEGDTAFVTPYFEEPSIRESMAFEAEVRTWHEHENPFKLIAGILKDRNIKNGKLAIEETVRHFIVDGIRHSAPNLETVSGDPITRGCRMYKSAAEIQLMKTANKVTLEAYRYVYKNIELGMGPREISSMMSDTTRKLGGDPQFSGVLLNEASAYPHGTKQPQKVKKNGIILMDCGCSVHDYESDISRTWVFGQPTKKQRQVWDTVKKGQEIALKTAKIGTPAGKVDDEVRAFYEGLGYGPGYQTPGLSHRLGHGIGIDGHEPVNFVHGETTKLSPGMCFSNEPGIYIFGEFGVRLEDCLHITETGPELFTDFSQSIDDPFG